MPQPDTPAGRSAIGQAGFSVGRVRPREFPVLGAADAPVHTTARVRLAVCRRSGRRHPGISARPAKRHARPRGGHQRLPQRVFPHAFPGPPHALFADREKIRRGRHRGSDRLADRRPCGHARAARPQAGQGPGKLLVGHRSSGPRPAHRPLQRRDRCRAAPGRRRPPHARRDRAQPRPRSAESRPHPRRQPAAERQHAGGTVSRSFRSTARPASSRPSASRRR